MKTQKRLILISLLTLGVLLLAATPATAAQPIKTESPFTLSSVLTDVCPFPVDVLSTGTYTEIDFMDENGALTRAYQHVNEQDTFTANGKTLVGVPFTFNEEFLFDNSGNVTHIYSAGGVEKVPLPDGTLFISAGRIDFINHLDVSFLVSPDKGHSGNIAGFCAALSP